MIFHKWRNSQGKVTYIPRIARNESCTYNRNVYQSWCCPATHSRSHSWLEQGLLILQSFSVAKVSQNPAKFTENFISEDFWPIWVLTLAIFISLGQGDKQPNASPRRYYRDNLFDRSAFIGQIMSLMCISPPSQPCMWKAHVRNPALLEIKTLICKWADDILKFRHTFQVGLRMGAGLA